MSIFACVITIMILTTPNDNIETITTEAEMSLAIENNDIDIIYCNDDSDNDIYSDIFGNISVNQEKEVLK